MKSKLSKSELVLILQRELATIEELCKQYDAGDKSIIHSIAEKILLIFHNSEKSKSLIAQLKLTHISMLCSSEAYDFNSLINFIGLLKLKHQTGIGWSYVVKLEHPSLATVSLENWWQNKKVIIDSDGMIFSRAKIIKALAGLNDITLNTSGWKLKVASGNKVNINPLPETGRQIAFELLERFKLIAIDKDSKLHVRVEVR